MWGVMAVLQEPQEPRRAFDDYKAVEREEENWKTG